MTTGFEIRHTASYASGCLTATLYLALYLGAAWLLLSVVDPILLALLVLIWLYLRYRRSRAVR
jgi:hypothetical protein